MIQSSPWQDIHNSLELLRSEDDNFGKMNLSLTEDTENGIKMKPFHRRD